MVLIIPAGLNAGFVLKSGKDLKVVIGKNEEQVVNTAFEMLKNDYRGVFNAGIDLVNKKPNVIIGTVGGSSMAEKLTEAEAVSNLVKHEEAFLITVNGKQLIILGSDKRGTAYGILELSRIIGVSPWVWWADSPYDKKKELVLKDGYKTMQYPSVARRGIFINDEDWGLMPWSNKNYEPSDVNGEIGQKTHARIFELLLRLRANTFWPAMHSCSKAFYVTPGNKEVADKYGIFVGTSHCEPMMRNTNAEWKQFGNGSYNYITNRNNVLKFWKDRVTELAGSDNIYTLGIRGVHDGRMEGARTAKEQKEALAGVIRDQREMLARYVNENVEEISQVFIPYKEVLYAYQEGLEVPEDVTLMWTDDNYGYIRHFPDSIERARKGGNGIYYHVSYWGRPHDYLWLATHHPALVYTQMKLAYEKGAREMWILNVGDIKPAEYLTELFMDMAWDINSISNNKEGLDKHLFQWLNREFGNEMAIELLPVLNEYYRLAYIRKPEFMGNTRTEEKDPAYKEVTDLPWSETYVLKRINEYEAISTKVNQLSGVVDAEKQSSWFQLVEYPVRAATAMNKKHLYGQLARHGKVSWTKSDEAYDEIVNLTNQYNLLNGSKWNLLMSYKPRNLNVYNRVKRVTANKALEDNKDPLFCFDGMEYTTYNGTLPISHGLGYNGGAVYLPKGSKLVYEFEFAGNDSLTVELLLAPFHPVEGTQLRYAVTLNDDLKHVIDYSTKGRSEEWKENVLWNRAVRKSKHDVSAGKQTLIIEALDEGVVLDQVKIWDDID